MARTKHNRGERINAIAGARTQKAILGLITGETTAYELTAASGTATGLNTPNRMRNSATLAAAPNLVVNVTGQTTYRVYGSLVLSLTAANGIKADFNAGTATIVTSSMFGNATFWTRGANASGTAIGATNAVPFTVNLTALNTAIDGGTSNTWTRLDFNFVCTVNVGGTLGFEFAQSSASTTNTDINGYMIAQPLDPLVA